GDRRDDWVSAGFSGWYCGFYARIAWLHLRRFAPNACLGPCDSGTWRRRDHEPERCARALYVSFKDARERAWLECVGRRGRRGLGADGGVRYLGRRIMAVAFRGERSHRDRDLPARAQI